MPDENTSYLVENGIIANDKPLHALENGTHFWVIKGVWHSEDPVSVITQGAIVLNEETIVRIDGPVCLFCGMSFDSDVVRLLGQCPGVTT
jgi:hypothetical protein